MPARVPRGGDEPGGIVGYPLDELHEEVAFVAYHFHWPLDQVLAMEHADRGRWVSEISSLNRHVNEQNGIAG